jgi:hypothetical protein
MLADMATQIEASRCSSITPRCCKDAGQSS